MLSLIDTLDKISSKINKLERTNDFDKLLTQYNKLSIKLNYCQKRLDIYKQMYKDPNEFAIIPEDLDDDNITDNDELYKTYIQRLKKLKQDISDSTQLEDQINIYLEAHIYLIYCKEYLNSCGINITKI